MLDAASKEFIRQRAETEASDTEIATHSCLQASGGDSDDERVSIGAKLQSFGLVSGIQARGISPSDKLSNVAGAFFVHSKKHWLKMSKACFPGEIYTVEDQN